MFLYVGNRAVVISINQYVVDIAVGVDTKVSYVGFENGNHVYGIRETLALRIRNLNGVAILEERAGV